MRRKYYCCANKEKQNRYDQRTNLGIDLEGQLSREAMLPKIFNKFLEMEARQIQYRKRAQELDSIQNLKEEVDRLRRHIYRLEDKKIIKDHLKTESRQKIMNDMSFLFRAPISQCHHFIQEDQDMYMNERKSRIVRNTEMSRELLRPEKLSLRIFQNQPKNDDSKKILQKRTSKIAQEKRKASEKNQKISKKKNKGKSLALRKFRIYALVVYFSIFFPSYSRRVYQNRLKQFMVEYPHDIGKYLPSKSDEIVKFKLDQKSILDKLQQKYDIMGMVQKMDGSSFLKEGGAVKQIKTHLQTILDDPFNENSKKEIKNHSNLEEQLSYPKNIEILIPKLQKIFIQFLKMLESLLSDKSFLSLFWKTLSMQILNNSFISNSHPKIMNKLIEIGIVKIHFSKETIQIYDGETESLLFVLDFICKIIVYNWFCKLQRMGQRISKINKLIGNLILSILYLLCMQLMESKILEFQKADLKMDIGQKLRNKKIRPIKPLVISRKNRKTGEKRILNLIEDVPFLDFGQTVLKENPKFTQFMKIKIKNFGLDFLDKIRQQWKINYQKIKKSSLEEFFLIHRDRHRVQNLEKYEQLKVLDEIEEIKHHQENQDQKRIIKVKAKIIINKNPDKKGYSFL